MRPVLIALPSKLLFVVAVVWAVVAFVLDVRRRKRDPKAPRSSTPLFLLVGAAALMGLLGGSWVPTPELFTAPWKPVPIHSYGVMLGTSMIVGWFLAMRLAKQDGIPPERAGSIYMWTAVWSIVGARLLYSIVQFNELDSVFDVFKIWEGGLVAYGGMIGGFLASWFNCRRAGIPLLRWADVAAPSVVLGTAITRVGCLLFGCDYGRRTDVAWGIRFPGPRALAPSGSPAWKDHLNNGWIKATDGWSQVVHPTQVYEMLAGLFLFGLLMYLRKVRRFSGQVFLGWVLGYGILRPIIEIYRDDDQRGAVGPLSTSQFIGLTSVALGVGLLFILRKRYKQDPAAMRLWEVPLAAPAVAEAPAGPARAAPAGKRRRR
jgi:phosphatidylglycerol---prolipoprotein diacylglyceryl transferase